MLMSTLIATWGILTQNCFLAVFLLALFFTLFLHLVGSGFFYFFFPDSGVSTLVMLHNFPADIICCWKFVCWEFCMFSRSHIVHCLDVDVS